MDYRARWQSLHASDGMWVPPVPRPAATMVLLRDGHVLLLRRSKTMPFAPGMHVFPGGGVSDADLSESDPLYACAVRETHEEVAIHPTGGRLFDRWVTPEVEERRYDVYFYVATTADEGRLVTSEAEEMLWLTPQRALGMHRAGDLPMLRPTAAVLETLTRGLPNGEESIIPKLPRFRPDGLWDIVDADTDAVLVSGVVGPTRAETDGAAMRTNG